MGGERITVNLRPAEAWPAAQLNELVAILSQYGPVDGQRTGAAAGPVADTLITFPTKSVAYGFLNEMLSQSDPTMRTRLLGALFWEDRQTVIPEEDARVGSLSISFPVSKHLDDADNPARYSAFLTLSRHYRAAGDVAGCWRDLKRMAAHLTEHVRTRSRPFHKGVLYYLTADDPEDDGAWRLSLLRYFSFPPAELDADMPMLTRWDMRCDAFAARLPHTPGDAAALVDIPWAERE